MEVLYLIKAIFEVWISLRICLHIAYMGESILVPETFEYLGWAPCSYQWNYGAGINGLVNRYWDFPGPTSGDERKGGVDPKDCDSGNCSTCDFREFGEM